MQMHQEYLLDSKNRKLLRTFLTLPSLNTVRATAANVPSLHMLHWHAKQRTEHSTLMDSSLSLKESDSLRRKLLQRPKEPEQKKNHIASLLTLPESVVDYLTAQRNGSAKMDLLEVDNALVLLVEYLYAELKHSTNIYFYI